MSQYQMVYKIFENNRHKARVTLLLWWSDADILCTLNVQRQVGIMKTGMLTTMGFCGQVATGRSGPSVKTTREIY